jgi:chemotaxis protein histidine kinase CheA
MTNWTTQQREWLIKQLTKYGLEQVDELVDYLLQCEDKVILKEYLVGLLGNDEEAEALVQELFAKQEATNEQTDGKGKDTPGYNKKVHKGRKKSYGPSKDSSSTEKDNKASTPFMRNCLCCGKVIMEYISRCSFCGWSPEEDAEKYGKALWEETFREATLSNSRSKRNRRKVESNNGPPQQDEYWNDSSDSEEMDEIDYEILSTKERLLELERNPIERLRVLDENTDYFDLSVYNQLREEEKNKLQMEQQVEKAKELEESAYTTFDMEGKVVYPSSTDKRPCLNPLLPGPSPLFIPTSTESRHQKG